LPIDNAILPYDNIALPVDNPAVDRGDTRMARAPKLDLNRDIKALLKGQPDEAIITRKIKGFVSRLSLTFSGTADLASKGEMISEFGERLAAWLVALSVWTEWHATHHPALDPCV